MFVTAVVGFVSPRTHLTQSKADQDAYVSDV